VRFNNQTEILVINLINVGYIGQIIY